MVGRFELRFLGISFYSSNVLSVGCTEVFIGFRIRDHVELPSLRQLALG